jgi:hypothetical protein
MNDPSKQKIHRCCREHAGKFNLDLAAVLALLLLGLWVSWMGVLRAAEVTERSRVPVVDGIVTPCRPVGEAIAQAMQFLKRADDGYVPGRIDGELAGYFTRAHVNEDGSRSDRQLAFPARQHAYFIFTFLRYRTYSGEQEWLLRARDLADWNLAHSTPSDAFYPNLPYSVFFVQFFEDVLRHENEPSWRQAHDRALKLMLERNVENNLWGTYHEDIVLKPESYLSAEPMSFTADYLFRHAKAHPEYIEMGRRILRRMEERLVHTEGHPAAPAPAVSEQAGFEHMMPGHTARYCLALADLYKVTGDEQAKKKAISGINALTYMQSEAGLFRTFFQLRNERKPGAKRPNWYSQHLYTVCHVLDAMPSLPEIGTVKRRIERVPTADER